MLKERQFHNVTAKPSGTLTVTLLNALGTFPVSWMMMGGVSEANFFVSSDPTRCRFADKCDAATLNVIPAQCFFVSQLVLNQ